MRVDNAQSLNLIHEWMVENEIGCQEDITLISRCRTWGSTALGHGGLGGNAMTTALTTLLTIGEAESMEAYVFFGGRVAYRVDYAEDSKFSDFLVDVGGFASHQAEITLRSRWEAEERYGAILL